MTQFERKVANGRRIIASMPAEIDKIKAARQAKQAQVRLELVKNVRRSCYAIAIGDRTAHDKRQLFNINQTKEA